MATRGFTLLELLLVLTMTGLLVALVAPRVWQWVVSAHARSVVEQTRADLVALPARAYLAGQALHLGGEGSAVRLPAGWRLGLEPARIDYQANGTTEGGELTLWEGVQWRARWRIEAPTGELHPLLAPPP